MSKDQCPVVASPDNKLQVINQVAFRDGFGCYLIEGTLKNVGPDSDLDAEIKIDYLDASNARVDTELDRISVPKTGKTRGFYLVYSGVRRGEVKSHLLHVSLAKQP